MFICLDKTTECDGKMDGRNPVASIQQCGHFRVTVQQMAKGLAV